MANQVTATVVTRKSRARARQLSKPFSKWLNACEAWQTGQNKLQTTSTELRALGRLLLSQASKNVYAEPATACMTAPGA